MHHNTGRNLYLFGEAVIRVRWHTSGDVEDSFHGGGSVVRSCQTRAPIPLEATHKATVCGQVHLHDTCTIQRVCTSACAYLACICGYRGCVGERVWLSAPPIQVQTQNLHRPGCLHCQTRWSTCPLGPLQCRTQQSCVSLDYRTKHIVANIKRTPSTTTTQQPIEQENLKSFTALQMKMLKTLHLTY